MEVNAETPVSPLPNMCWYVGFRGDERAHDTVHPGPICFKPAEGREVGLVEAGLNQPGIADRHVDAMLNPMGHRGISPLRDTASAFITDTVPVCR